MSRYGYFNYTNKLQPPNSIYITQLKHVLSSTEVQAGFSRFKTAETRLNFG
jgi:hypothetical protein